MILNYDYRRMLRAGYFAERGIPQKENDAAIIVTWSIGMALMMCLFAVVFQSCGLAGGVR